MISVVDFQKCCLLVVLPFRLGDFLRDKHKGTTDSIRVQGSTTYQPLKNTKTRLLAKDGPRLVVDLDDRIILFYNPYFLGTGLQVRDLYLDHSFC